MKDIVLSWLFFIFSGALVLQWLMLMDNLKDIKQLRKSYTAGDSMKLAEVKFLESKNSNYIGWMFVLGCLILFMLSILNEFTLKLF